MLGGLVEDEVMRLAIEVEEAAAEPPKVRRRGGGREMNGVWDVGRRDGMTSTQAGDWKKAVAGRDSGPQADGARRRQG